MIRRRQCQNLMRVALQLQQDADANDAEVITQMADFLEAHNAQMQAAAGSHTSMSVAPSPFPPPPQTKPSAYSCEASPGKFDRLQHAFCQAQHRLSLHAGEFIEMLLESGTATDLAAYCMKWQLDYSILHAERGALFSLGTDAYLAHVIARDAAGVLPQLMDERVMQPSSEGLWCSSDTAGGVTP